MSRQLLIYGFAQGADFEGRLTGALERMESGGALRILDVLFLAADPQTGELAAIGLPGGVAGTTVAPLLEFRLDSGARSRATARALEAPPAPGHVAPQTLRALGRTLAPGEALAAVLVEHVWAAALEEAVQRCDGTQLGGPFVEAGALAELAPELLEVAGA